MQIHNNQKKTLVGQCRPLTEDGGHEERLEKIPSAFSGGNLIPERRTKGAVSHRFLPLTVIRRQYRIECYAARDRVLIYTRQVNQLKPV